MELEQEELQFLGVFGIYKQSYKLIYSWRKIFSQITLALILPFSFIFLSHIQVSDRLFSKIMTNEMDREETPLQTPQYTKLTDILSHEWTMLILFKFAYFTFLLIFSLLSTAAVVYTVACVFTGRQELTFKKVMNVVPRVWKRLMMTFLSIFIATTLYNLVSFSLLVACVMLVGVSSIGLTLIFVMFLIYMTGMVYMTVVWQMACVVSVLEDVYGFKAMVKSKDLIKGKLIVAIVIFIKYNLSLMAIQVAFESLVANGGGGTLGRIGVAVVCFLLLFTLVLFGLVVQTVIYFVCKSYHHENIDKSTLSGHLDTYLGDYVLLKPRDLQLEQFHV